MPFTFPMKMPITANTSDSSRSSKSSKTKVGHVSPGGTIRVPEEADFLLLDLGVRRDMGNRGPQGQTMSSKCHRAGGGKRCRKIPSRKVQLGFYVDPNLGGRTTKETEPLGPGRGEGKVAVGSHVVHISTRPWGQTTWLLSQLPHLQPCELGWVA